MNNESIKLLSEADHKASEIVKKAREERNRLKIDAQKRGEEYEKTLLEKKCQEIKQLREDISNHLLQLEQTTQQYVEQTLQKIEENQKCNQNIVEALAKLVTDEE